MAQARATKVIGLVELTGASARATQVIGLVEIGSARILATQVVALVEIDIPVIVVAPGDEKVRIIYNGVELTNFLNDATLNVAHNIIDAMDYTLSKYRNVPGLGRWNLEISGFWSYELDEIIAPDVIAPPSTLRDLTIVINGEVRYDWAERAFVVRHQPQADAKGVLRWSGRIHGSGWPTRTLVE